MPTVLQAAEGYNPAGRGDGRFRAVEEATVKTRVRLVLPFLVFLLPACAPKTPVQSAGVDQEITRAILWEYRKHPALADVRVSCSNHVVRLEGRVPDRPALEEALRIASRHCRGAEIDSRLAIMPR